MDVESTKIKEKIEDYSRFLITLIILSVYFYLGMVINTFLEPSGKNKLLIVLLLVSLTVSGWFLYLLSSWRKKLDNILEQ